MRRIKIVLSDLHMGFGRVTTEGTINDMEDFVSDQALIDLLEYYRTGEFVDADVELVLNGDIFEGLVALPPDNAPDMITEAKSIAKITAIIEGHQAVFSAIGVFAAGENRQVTVLVGNHDQDLLWEGVKELLLDKIHPSIRFIDDIYFFDGIHLEHGHQHEHQNAVSPHKMFLTKGLDEPILNLPWGSDMFVNTLLPIKRIRPYINRIRPLRLFFNWSLWNDFSALAKFIGLVFIAVIKARFRKPKARQKTIWQTLRVIFGASAYPTLEPEARRIMQNNTKIHTVIFGHTHIPMWRQVLPNKTYVNSGSWIPTSNLHISALGSSLLQTYVYIEYDENSIPRASLKRWYGRRVVEEDIQL